MTSFGKFKLKFEEIKETANRIDIYMLNFVF